MVTQTALPVPPRNTSFMDLLSAASRLATVALIIFMLLIPYSTWVDPTGASLLLVLKYSNFLWAAYITVQVLESVQRDFVDKWGWVTDNVLAIGALLVGSLVYFEVLTFVPLNFDQRHLLVEGLVWNSVDLITGMIIPFVIAGSIRNRHEL